MATEELPTARAGALAAPEPLLANLPPSPGSPSRRSSLTLATSSLPAASAMEEQQHTISEKSLSPTKSQPSDAERGAGEGGGGDGKDASRESTTAPGGPPHFPDGGTRAYLAALGGSLVLLSTFGYSNAWGAIQAEFQRNQLRDSSPSSISWIGSLHLCILFACGLPAGRVFDLGYFRYQLAFGSVLWVFGMFMMSISTQYYQFILSYSVCMGLALGCVFAPTLSCVGSYFLKKRSLMLGCVAGGAALGAVFLPIAMNRMYANPRMRFGNATRVVAALDAFLLLIANVIMTPRRLPPKKQKVKTIPLIRGFLRQPSTWLGCGGAAFVMLGMFIPLFYIQVFSEANGASQVIVDYSLAYINCTAFAARLCMGLVADRLGIFNTAIPIAFGTGVLIFAMLGATATASALVWCLLYGWFMGAWVTHMAPSLMSLAQDVSEIGARAGLGFLFVSIACLIGNPIAGALLRSTGSYVAPCVFGGCSTLLGTGLLLAVRFTQVKRRGHWKV